MGVGTRIVSTGAAVPSLGHARASRPCQARHTANGKVNFAIALPLEAVPSEQPATFDEIVETWLPLTYALNAVNRSMGVQDLYPFVLAPKVLEKLRFVHDLVTAHLPYRTPGEAAAAPV